MVHSGFLVDELLELSYQELIQCSIAQHHNDNIPSTSMFEGDHQLSHKTTRDPGWLFMFYSKYTRTSRKYIHMLNIYQYTNTYVYIYIDTYLHSYRFELVINIGDITCEPFSLPVVS